MRLISCFLFALTFISNAFGAERANLAGIDCRATNFSDYTDYKIPLVESDTPNLLVYKVDFDLQKFVLEVNQHSRTVAYKITGPGNLKIGGTAMVPRKEDRTDLSVFFENPETKSKFGFYCRPSDQEE